MLRKDSRKVEVGDTFVDTTSNKEYVYDAVKNGAVEIISKIKYDDKTIIIDDPKKYYNDYIYNKFYDKINDLNLIGVTGTNGKTTTCYIIYQILNYLGIRCAYIGTLGFYKCGSIKTLKNTTPDIDELYDCLRECYDENIKYVVMEVSSHSLIQDRVYGLKFNGAIFTNLSEDHLDYHKSMENYKKAKVLLFDRLKKSRVAVINSDDEYYRDFIFDNNYNIMVGYNGDLKINNINLKDDSIDIDFNFKKNYQKNIKMVGSYNVYNYLEAVGLLVGLGFNISDILNVPVSSPPGRMYFLEYNSNSIFIDYAHTPDAMEKVLKSVRNLKKNRIIIVFGCGGNREKEKRCIMGCIASKYSDFVIITNDNPRLEDEDDIISDILNGVVDDNYEVIKDRRLAIKKGINYLNQNDVLLILGKGHEDYQIIGDKTIHFSDLEVVNEFIKDNLF